MGGMGSGRCGAHHHLVEHSLILDLPLLVRRGRVLDGHKGSGRLCFAEGGEPCLIVNFLYDLTDPYHAWLGLKFTRVFYGGDRREIMQLVPLKFTEPNFGGRRWWMICPSGGRRVAKLYLPPGGDTFACREAWGLVYESQRQNERERVFGRLSRLQRKLGCEQRWGAEPTRPKGMWWRTFERLCREYLDIDARCAAQIEGTLAQLRSRHA